MIVAESEFLHAGVPQISFRLRDVGKDGAFQLQRGSDAAILKVIASGGVRSVEDIAAAQAHSLGGIIVGRALYEGSIDLEKAINAYQILASK